MKLSEAVAWEPTERWTIADAGELYDVASWGKGYFSVGSNGHLWVHPTKDASARHRPPRAGRKIRTARNFAPHPHPFRRNSETSARRTPSVVSELHCRARLQGQLLLRVSDQSQPAAPSGRRSLQVRAPLPFRPGSRLQARVARGARHRRQRDPHHLQRLQGRRVHRNGDARPKNRPPDHSGRREVHRARSGGEAFAARRRAPGHRTAPQARQQRLRPLEVLRRLSLQVRPHRERSAAGARSDESRRHGGLHPVAPLPPRQPDHQHPADQGRGDRSRPHLCRAEARRRRPEIPGRRRRPRASTTTARKPTSSPASITRCRNTRTTSSITFRTSATKPKWNTPPSFPKAAAPSPPTTASWCSTFWA